MSNMLVFPKEIFHSKLTQGHGQKLPDMIWGTCHASSGVTTVGFLSSWLDTFFCCCYFMLVSKNIVKTLLTTYSVPVDVVPSPQYWV